MKREATEFNVTALADAGKPATAGKKRKGISKKASKRVKSLCLDTDDSLWSYPHTSNPSGASPMAPILQTPVSLSSQSPVPQTLTCISAVAQTPIVHIHFCRILLCSLLVLCIHLPLCNQLLHF